MPVACSSSVNMKRFGRPFGRLEVFVRPVGEKNGLFRVIDTEKMMKFLILRRAGADS